jgi:hypothetical protein
MSLGPIARRRTVLGRTSLFVVGAALMALVTGCGDDDDEPDTPRVRDLEENLCGSMTSTALGRITGAEWDEYTYVDPSECHWSDDDPLTGPVVIRLVSSSYNERVEEQALNTNFDLDEDEIDGVKVTFVEAPEDATVIAAIDGEDNPAVEITATTLDQAKAIAEEAIDNINSMVG